MSSANGLGRRVEAQSQAVIASQRATTALLSGLADREPDPGTLYARY
jgi:hypothetical protein